MTQPVVVFPDTAAAICTHLADELGVTTGSKVPDDRPVEFVLVRRVGGPRRDVVVDDATLTVETWAATEADAHDLSQQCRALIHAMAGATFDDVTVYRCVEFAGPAQLPDPLSQQPRYTFTIAVSVRGTSPVGS